MGELIEFTAGQKLAFGVMFFGGLIFTLLWGYVVGFFFVLGVLVYSLIYSIWN